MKRAHLARGSAFDARESIERHGKSFALASRLLGPEPCREVSIVYAYCRRCDDAIDHAASEDEARAALRRLHRELDDLYSGRALDDATLRAFQHVVFTRGIPRRYPQELVLGMAMDVEGHRYDTLDDLVLYAYRVAGVVGLMLCHVFGLSDPRALQNAAHLGIAMQFTNIARDVDEDYRRGRRYLPAAFLPEAARAHPAPTDAGVPEVLRAPYAACTARLLALADGYYRSGDLGLRALPFRAALAVRCARLVYSAIGTRVRRAGCDPRAGRAVVPGFVKGMLVVRAIASSLASIPSRMARAVRAHADRRSTRAWLPPLAMLGPEQTRLGLEPTTSG